MDFKTLSVAQDFVLEKIKEAGGMTSEDITEKVKNAVESNTVVEKLSERLEELECNAKREYETIYGYKISTTNDMKYTAVSNGIISAIPCPTKNLKYKHKDNKYLSTVRIFQVENYDFSDKDTPVVSISGIYPKDTSEKTVTLKDKTKYLLVSSEKAGDIWDIFEYLILDDVDLLYEKKPKFEMLSERIETLEKASEDNLDIVTLNGGDLVIRNKLWALQMGDTGTSDSQTKLKDILTVMHITDIHGNGENLKRIVDFMHQYKSYIDIAVSSGDQVSGYFTEDFTFWEKADSNSDVIFCLGNHDTWVKTTDTAFTDEDLYKKTSTYNVINEALAYDKYFASRIEGWGVVYESGKNYFYKDLKNDYYAIRILFIDVMHPTAEQKTWFADTLSDAKEKGFSVIVVSHFEGGDHKSVPTPFCSREYGSAHGTGYADSSFYMAISSFIDNGGEFVMWLTGHTHVDKFGVLQKDERQVDSNMSTSGALNRTGDFCPKNGLRSQDCIDLIGIDTVDKVIKIMRVGRDYDRYMQHKDTMCYDYGNHKLLYPTHE